MCVSVAAGVFVWLCVRLCNCLYFVCLLLCLIFVVIVCAGYCCLFLYVVFGVFVGCMCVVVWLFA